MSAVPQEMIDAAAPKAIAALGTAAPPTLRGGDFIFDIPDVQVVWGTEIEVAWSGGEPLLIAGRTSIGKTTLAQNLVLARIGLRQDVLGMPVVADDKQVLYVAADRPKQVARSFRRMVVEEEHRVVLNERLLIHKGPPPNNISREPERFAEWVLSSGAGTVVIDSLKDCAADVVKNEGGAAVAEAFQRIVAGGVEVVANHHNRKSNADNRKPKMIDDIYGSVLIPATCGTVMILWGEPGDTVVELSQVKNADGDIGPLIMEMDLDTGSVSRIDAADALTLLQAIPGGMTAREMARFLSGTGDKSAENRARRKLNKLVERGIAVKSPGGGFGGNDHTPDRYFAAQGGVPSEHEFDLTDFIDGPA